jgi:threonine/homoserine efflux transporter RhtA
MKYTFIIAFIVHFLAFYISYNKGLKGTAWFYPIGITLGAISTGIWYYLAKNTLDPSKLLVYGIYWDVMVAACWIGGPMIFYEAVLTSKQWVGLAMIICGLIALK